MARSFPHLVAPLLLAAAMAGGARVPARAAGPELTAVPAPSAVPAPTRNIERLERAAAAAADSLLGAVGGGDSLCVAVVPHDAAWLVEGALVERATARGLVVRRCDRADAGRVDVAITAIGVLYHRIDAGIERVAALSLSASAPGAAEPSGGALRSIRVAVALADTLAEADTTGLADAAYPYTVGTLDAVESGGFWRTIVEPAVVLAASAIVAILLFTVRSQ